MYPHDAIVEHADLCAQSKEADKETEVTKESDILRSLTEELSDVREKIEVESWNVSVIRRSLYKTAIQALEDADEEDWNMSLHVTFIGEDAVDVGGPQRELFSLLFKSSDILQGTAFQYSSEMLQKKHYHLFGRAVSYALVTGHPGPKCFHPLIVKYILDEEVPTAQQIDLADLHNEEAVTAITKINGSTSDDLIQVSLDNAEVLGESGFRRVLTMENKNVAVTSIKEHYFFYRGLGPLRQFMDGLKDKGILDMLRKHRAEAVSILSSASLSVTAEQIKTFFRYALSQNSKEKELEEVAVCHFHKFLTQVEKKKVSCLQVDPYKDPYADDAVVKKIVTLEEVMQAFTGCPGIPRDITTGLIVFDHKATGLCSVNTCAPSITLTSFEKLDSYAKVEEMMINIIVGELGFGME